MEAILIAILIGSQFFMFWLWMRAWNQRPPAMQAELPAPVAAPPSLPHVGREELMRLINTAIVEQAAYEQGHKERQQARLAGPYLRHQLKTAKLEDGERRPVAHYDPDQRLKSVELKVRAACAALRLAPPGSLVEIIAERLEDAYAA